MSQSRRLVHIIKQFGTISKWELMDKAKMSISTYNKLKPFICYKWEGEIEYDKGTEAWKFIGNVSIEKESVQEELKVGK